MWRVERPGALRMGTLLGATSAAACAVPIFKFDLSEPAHATCIPTSMVAVYSKVTRAAAGEAASPRFELKPWSRPCPRPKSNAASSVPHAVAQCTRKRGLPGTLAPRYTVRNPSEAITSSGSLGRSELHAHHMMPAAESAIRTKQLHQYWCCLSDPHRCPGSRRSRPQAHTTASHRLSRPLAPAYRACPFGVSRHSPALRSSSILQKCAHLHLGDAKLPRLCLDRLWRRPRLRIVPRAKLQRFVPRNNAARSSSRSHSRCPLPAPVRRLSTELRTRPLTANASERLGQRRPPSPVNQVRCTHWHASRRITMARQPCWGRAHTRRRGWSSLIARHHLACWRPRSTAGPAQAQLLRRTRHGLV